MKTIFIPAKKMYNCCKAIVCELYFRLSNHTLENQTSHFLWISVTYVLLRDYISLQRHKLDRKLVPGAFILLLNAKILNSRMKATLPFTKVPNRPTENSHYSITEYQTPLLEIGNRQVLSSRNTCSSLFDFTEAKITAWQIQVIVKIQRRCCPSMTEGHRTESDRATSHPFLSRQLSPCMTVPTQTRSNHDSVT